MSDYIPREAAIEKKFHAGLCDAYGNEYGSAEVVLADDIAAIPAADVRPVVRGRWVSTGAGRLTSKCSVCGYKSIEDGNYCPNCGADMRPTSMSVANGERKD